MIDALNSWIATGASLFWGSNNPWFVYLLFGTHLLLTVRTGFIQRHLGQAIRLSVTPDKGAPGDVSQFGALVTALAATIGTGNIYGVAGAVLIGGPGAVLWMWLTGVFGIATKYSEALLSVKYRTVDKRGQMLGGPMVVLDRALHAKWAGVFFAIFTAVAAFGIGNMVQASAITDMVVAKKAIFGWGWDDAAIKLSLGIAMTVFTAIVAASNPSPAPARFSCPSWHSFTSSGALSSWLSHGTGSGRHSTSL